MSMLVTQEILKKQIKTGHLLLECRTGRLYQKAIRR